MRISLPTWIMQATLFFAPQPKWIFCLGGYPEVIYARKPETSLAEVIRQQDELKKLIKNNRMAIWIDTGISIEESKNHLLNVIRNSS